MGAPSVVFLVFSSQTPKASKRPSRLPKLVESPCSPQCAQILLCERGGGVGLPDAGMSTNISSRGKLTLPTPNLKIACCEVAVRNCNCLGDLGVQGEAPRRLLHCPEAQFELAAP